MPTCPDSEKQISVCLRCLRTYFLFLLIPVSALVLIGCAFPPEYPAQLPPLSAGVENFKKCPCIEGSFSDKGEAFTTKGELKGKVSLSQFLHNNDPCYALADSVVIERRELTNPSASGAQNIIEIISLKDGQPFAKWRTDMGYSGSCKKGFFSIAQSESTGAISGYPGGIGMWSYANSVRLSRALDGSLIVLSTQDSTGFIVFFPYYSKQNLWYRFPPVENDTPPGP
jgi:hypothetical protein